MPIWVHCNDEIHSVHNRAVNWLWLWSIIVLGDQLLPFSRLIGRLCDHHFMPSFGKYLCLLAMSVEISRCLKVVVLKALQVYTVSS